MLNSKESLICDKFLELFPRPMLWKQTENDLLFVGPHSTSNWTSARQTLHLFVSAVTLCVGLALSSPIDSSGSVQTVVRCAACAQQQSHSGVRLGF
mgnify:CR=1 FL=1